MFCGDLSLEFVTGTDFHKDHEGYTHPKYSDSFSWYIKSSGKAYNGKIEYGKRLLLQKLDPFVKWNVVRPWIATAPTIEPVELVRDLKVVDVTNRCIVPAPRLCRYATLSYVWGDIGGTFSPGALEDDTLPATIVDAMDLCRQLRIQYLWVDLLCIQQDDEQDRAYQISNMDRTCHAAVVCIVAAAGKDARYGLPGVSRARTWRPSHIRIVDIELREQRRSFPIYIDLTKWGSRGWTFQEYVLSNRLLYFTELGVVYGTMPSADAFELPLRTESQMLKGYYNKRLSDKDSYGSLISEYTKRTLTFEEDVLNAINGVLSRCLSAKHSYGMAHDQFDRAILGETVDEYYSWRPDISHVWYSTWSWASAPGWIRIQDYLTDLDVRAIAC